MFPDLRQLLARPLLGLACCGAVWVGWDSAAAAAHSPDSSVVKPMVDKAAQALEGLDATDVGGKCLIGLALYKTERPVGHPKIQSAIKHARDLAATVAREGYGYNCYNETIACIFLCDVAPQECRSEINVLVSGLLQRQITAGSWTYKGVQESDTSQTQYGMLTLWSAHSVGITAPVPALERAAHWLMRSQSADGGFGYHPPDPGVGKSNGVLTDTSLSMSAAGLGSLYLTAHILGGGRAEARKTKDKGKELPPAVTRVSPDKDQKGFVMLRPQTLDLAALRRACAAGDRWFDKNFRPNNENQTWTYYYLYGLERYKSFKEFVEGQTDAEPAWYNTGVEYLQQNQKASGVWTNFSSYGDGIDTAFAVLFLVRSTQKTIKKVTQEEGILIGGKGLPKNLANARLVDGKVVTPQMVKDVEDFLQLLKDTEHKEFDPLALAGSLSLDEDLTKRTSQIARLRELVTAVDFGARLTAVKTLARAGELDNVPALVYALSDPDPNVVREAREGLRFVSRRLQGVGPVSGKPTPQEIETEQAKWKEWLRSIRPDAEFID